MLKLLLCTIAIAPCLIIPFAGSASSDMTALDVTSFEDAYVEPEFEQLENCEAAELDVYFHKNYITLHSAEYIAKGLDLSKVCGNAEYVITPIIPSSSHVTSEDVLGVQTEELIYVLDAHGVEARVENAAIQNTFDSLSANGRTATLSIIFDDSNNS